MSRIDELELVIRRKDGKVVAGIPEIKRMRRRTIFKPQ